MTKIKKVELASLFSGIGGVAFVHIENKGRIEDNSLPSVIYVGRDFYLQLPQITENLYDILSEKGSMVDVEVYKRDEENKGSVKLVKSKYPIDLDLFPSFVHAVSKNLSNQSYLSGNFVDENNNVILRGNELIRSERSGSYVGNITMSLRSFIQDVYGTKKPSSLQEKKVIGLLRALQDTFLHITRANGASETASLCYFSFSKAAANAPQMIHLNLHPIWSETLKGLGKAPQDLAYSLTDALGNKKTPTHMKLINLLIIQDKRKPFRRNIDTLVKDLGLENYYQKNKKMVEEKITSTCSDLKEIGLIANFTINTTTGRGRAVMSSIEIYLPSEK